MAGALPCRRPPVRRTSLPATYQAPASLHGRSEPGLQSGLGVHRRRTEQKRRCGGVREYCVIGETPRGDDCEATLSTRTGSIERVMKSIAHG